jgi:hypothetical protein
MHYERRPPGRSRLGVACLRSVAHWSGWPRRAVVGQGEWSVLPSEKAVVCPWARRMALYLRGEMLRRLRRFIHEPGSQGKAEKKSWAAKHLAP